MNDFILTRSIRSDRIGLKYFTIGSDQIVVESDRIGSSYKIGSDRIVISLIQSNWIGSWQIHWIRSAAHP